VLARRWTSRFRRCQPLASALLLSHRVSARRGARTALFNWLFAVVWVGCRAGIEDTDVERSSADMVEGIIDACGGSDSTGTRGRRIGGPHAPYFQSERLDRYRAMAERLVAAVRVLLLCTPEELQSKRDAGEKK